MASFKISVIIPVYNTAQYLERCLTSILNQSFSDYEVIIVDDGSTDNSLDICNTFAAEHSRVTVLHQENGGVSSARNLALDCARGEWITFVDSDDYVTHEYLSKLYEVVSIGDKDILIFQGFSAVNEAGDIISEIRFKQKRYERAEFSELFNEFDLSSLGCSVSKLYNKEVLNNHNIRFINNLSYGEDRLFMCQYIDVCSGVFMIDGCGYNYFITRCNSLTKQHVIQRSSYKLFYGMDLLINRNWSLWGITTKSDILISNDLILYQTILSCYYKETRKPRAERIVLLRKASNEHRDSILRTRASILYIFLIKLLIRLRLVTLLDAVLSLLINK